jgi:GNAT superfamily N-acetyltransferase
MAEYQIEAGEDQQQIINSLEDKIYKFNSTILNRNDGSLFSKIIKDEKGNLVAGLAGWTWAGACEITQLWISEDLRHKGLGTKLLIAAEEEAKSKNCTIILIKTYSFQAPGFYEKNGYRIRQVIEGFPEGYNYFTLTKNIE